MNKKYMTEEQFMQFSPSGRTGMEFIYQNFIAGENIKKGQKVEVRNGKLYPVKTEREKTAIIKSCILYILHRMRVHPGCGASAICSKQTLERILDEIE